jgi:hypothetical protein
MVFDGGIQMQPEGGEFTGPRLTTNQYRAGFALVRVATNAAPWFTVPSNAVLHAPWTRYGVAEDTFWLPATNWVFILGTNAVDGVHVSSSGTLSFGWPKGSPRARELPDGSELDFMAPLQTSIGIAPPAGRFWHAPTLSNSLLLTWQDVYANRDTNYPVTFQSELFASGDITFRYDLSRFPSPVSCFPSPDFTIGAQHNGGGETYAFSDTNRLVNGLELRWRAFGLLDPGIDDHDGDGLSTYDEVMVYGTNPRRADTDGDGLSDYNEVHGSTNPLHPDTDGDGIPDGMTLTEWQSNALFVSDSNRRTITIHRTTAIPSFATAVLRFGSLPIVLAGAESWTIHVPTGTVYMAELVTTGNPAIGLDLTAEAGIFLDNPDGVIQQSSLYGAGSSSPELLSLSGMSSGGYSGGVSGGSFFIISPGVQILPFMVLMHDEEWVSLMCSVNPSNSTATTLLSWSVSDEFSGHGITFTPETGLSTMVYWPLSSGLDAIVVTARLTDTQGGTITATRILTRCTANEPLHWTSGTDNFSPHLGESTTFGCGAGCGHTSDYVGQWVEIEVTRETVNGTQHVAWLDADPLTAGSQRRAQLPWAWQSTSSSWGGIATESVAEAVSPDKFDEGVPPFHRILPAVVSGKPVPPPFHDLYVRIRDGATDTAPVVAEISRRVYVPQVVKISWDSSVVSLFAQSLSFNIWNCPTNLYSGCTLDDAETFLATIPALVQTKFPTDMNIRVVDGNTSVLGDYKHARILVGNNPDGPLGLTSNNVFPNRRVAGDASVFLLSLRQAVFLSHGQFVGNIVGADPNWASVVLPLTPPNWVCMLAGTTVHEIGHTLGLVSQSYLAGTVSSHNGFVNPAYLMNRGDMTPLYWHMEIPAERTWYWRSDSFLRFLLPEEP